MNLVSVNPSTEKEKFVQYFNCEAFFVYRQKNIISIMQDSLIEVETLTTDMKKLKMQKVNVHSTKKSSVSSFCEGCKELQQKVDGLEQDNAQLWTVVNSLIT